VIEVERLLTELRTAWAEMLSKYDATPLERAATSPDRWKRLARN